MQLSQLIASFLLALTLFSLVPTRLFALYDPLTQANNRVGIHILDPHELPLAAELINSSGGDWGYVTVVIRSDDRNYKKWQDFFNDARTRHVIPIMRLATKTQNDYWLKPGDNDAIEWANFLGSLYWPTNNHYIVAYNEPNQAKEWGNTIDPEGYAKELSKTIDSIKAKDPNAFILNAGFDAAAPTVDGQMLDETAFLDRMNKAVPGIFTKLNGWSSHSYPQPNFSGSPLDVGRNTITTYRWEEQVLKDGFGVINLPVFITETGWVHADGLHPNISFLAENQIAENFKTAYTQVWTDSTIVAVTPFTLTYDQAPFDHFSWIRTPQLKSPDIVSIQTQPQFNQFQTTKELAKGSGQPVQASTAEIKVFDLPASIGKNAFVAGEIRIKNTGEKTWFAHNNTAVLAVMNDDDTVYTSFPVTKPVIPGETLSVPVTLLTPAKAATYQVRLAIKDNTNEIVHIPYQLTVGTPHNLSFGAIVKRLAVKLFS